MKPVFMAITLAVFCASSFSQGYITPLGQGIEVLKIHGHRDGGITVWVDSSSVQNPDNCGGVDRLHIPSNLQGYDTMVTLVTTAFTANKKIGFWSSGCDNIPFWGSVRTYPIIKDVWLTN